MKSIKNQLFISFLSITLVLSSISLIAFILLNRSDAIQAFKEKVDVNSNRLETMNVLKMRFLLEEVYKEEFHEIGFSKVLEEHDSIQKILKISLFKLQQANEASKFKLESLLSDLLDDVESQEKIFDELVEQIRYNGFKDFGLIGKMRTSIHELESNAKLISLTDILMLRRHEKDFLLRQDTQYANLLNELCKRIIGKIRDKEGSESEIKLLSNYQRDFDELVHAQGQIGNFGVSGTKEKLSKKMQYVTMSLDRIGIMADAKAIQLISNVKIIYIVSTIFILIVGIALSYQQANKRSHGLRTLANAVEQKELSTSDPELHLNLEKASTELINLHKAFNRLLNKTSDQIKIIEEKSNELKIQNRELVKVNNELDRFVYSVSHDLRSPLASVLGLIYLTKGENDIKKIMEYNILKEVSIKKLDGFIKDIISLSRNARQSVKIEKINFKLLAEEIFSNFNHYGEADRVKKIINVNQKYNFHTDEKRLQIILNNLVSNSIRYANKKGSNSFVEIDVRVSNSSAEIMVKDNGTGIGEEHLENIFQMFYRATDDNNGSGLGLYITKEAVSKIEGEISVKSKINEGTTFTLRIPNLLNRANNAISQGSVAVEA